MKHYLFILCMVLTHIPCLSQDMFDADISGSSSDPGSNRLFIEYEIAGTMFKDSVTFTGGVFRLKKQLPQPVAASLYTNNENIPPTAVFLSGNSLTVTITKQEIATGRSSLQDAFLELTTNDRIRPRYFPLYGELNAKNDTLGLRRLAVSFDSLRVDDVNRSYRYFKANPSSALSLFAFARYCAFSSDYGAAEADFNLLPLWAKNTPDGQNIAAKIRGAKSAQVGTSAKAFTQATPTGSMISLSDFKGKYVLLDFWASWCGPCRKEHPNLINMYRRYRDRNFEIVSVSLDNKQDAWLKAIAKDQLPWPQVSDLKGQQNAIALLYGVQAIPMNFLIDPEGRIIDKDLKGAKLNEKLATLFGASKKE